MYSFVVIVFSQPMIRPSVTASDEGRPRGAAPTAGGSSLAFVTGAVLSDRSWSSPRMKMMQWTWSGMTTNASSCTRGYLHASSCHHRSTIAPAGVAPRASPRSGVRPSMQIVTKYAPARA